MLISVLNVLLVYVAYTSGDSCHYKSKGSSELKSYHCEEGCCGDLDEQECCKSVNWWMVFAFVLVALFIIIVITIAIYVIVKQKNKKKERVGTRRNDRGYDDQPNTVDLSIFRTENRRRTTHDLPPAYSFDDPPPTDAWEANHLQNPDRRRHGNAEYFVPVINAGNQNQRRSRDEFIVPEVYREDVSHTRNEPSWRDTDLSYFDKYLERSRNPDARNQVSYPAFSSSGGHLPPKEEPEYEDFRISAQPDFTAEVSYRGQTSHQMPQHPVLERTDSSTFHFMAHNGAS